MNKENMKKLVNDYRLGFITGMELVNAYLVFIDDNPTGFSQAASDILYEADELIRPLSRKIEKEIDRM